MLSYGNPLWDMGKCLRGEDMFEIGNFGEWNVRGGGMLGYQIVTIFIQK